MIRKAFMLFAFIMIAGFSYSSINIDSLHNIWTGRDSSPSNRLKAGHKLIIHKYRKLNMDSCSKVAEDMLVLFDKSPELSKIPENLFYKAEALRSLGIIKHFQFDYTTSFDYYQQALKIAQEINNKLLESDVLMNISSHYSSNEMFSMAMNYLVTAQRINLEIGDTIGAGYLMNNIGTIYIRMENYDQANICYEKALEIAFKNNNKAIEQFCYINFAEIAKKNGDFKKAVGYCKKAIEVCLEQGDTVRYAIAEDQIAQIYLLMDSFEDAKSHALNSISLHRKVSNVLQATSPILTLSKALIKQGSYQFAIDSLQNAIRLINQQPSPDLGAKIYYQIYLAYKLMGINDSALVFFEKYSAHNDLLSSQRKSKDVLLKVTQKKFLKQALSDSIYYAQQAKIKDEEIVTKKEQLSKEKILRYGLIAVLLYAMALAFFLYKQRNIISKQKKEVDLAHRSIQDSIEYSQRIQQAVLPSKERVSAAFKDHFILFLPKDIVSGDFYWIHNFGNKKLLALGDCTGHGVPGAFMSIMSINILTQIIEEGFTMPKDILAEVDQRIIRRLRQHDESVKDGMDIAMCLVEGSRVVFSSSHISMYRISKGILHQYRGSSVYLGDGDTSRLESVEIEVDKGDLLYMFTDGYADQKGGSENRKFYSKNVQNMILENHSLPLKEQLALLERSFMDWKNSNQQVDDVSVMGFRI